MLMGGDGFHRNLQYRLMQVYGVPHDVSWLLERDGVIFF